MALAKAHVERDDWATPAGKVTTTTSLFERPRIACVKCGSTDYGVYESDSHGRPICPPCNGHEPMSEIIETTTCPMCQGTGEVAVKDLAPAD